MFTFLSNQFLAGKDNPIYTTNTTDLISDYFSKFISDLPVAAVG
jgi:hypothetical protein